MGWIKAQLPADWHSKLKHYRDETQCSSLSEAVVSLVKRGIIAYESENGALPDEYEKDEHPTWSHRNE